MSILTGPSDGSAARAGAEVRSARSRWGHRARGRRSRPGSSGPGGVQLHAGVLDYTPRADEILGRLGVPQPLSLSMPGASHGYPAAETSALVLSRDLASGRTCGQKRRDWPPRIVVSAIRVRTGVIVPARDPQWRPIRRPEPTLDRRPYVPCAGGPVYSPCCADTACGGQEGRNPTAEDQLTTDVTAREIAADQANPAPATSRRPDAGPSLTRKCSVWVAPRDAPTPAQAKIMLVRRRVTAPAHATAAFERLESADSIESQGQG
jgi:hypothetical protein